MHRGFLSDIWNNLNFDREIWFIDNDEYLISVIDYFAIGTECWKSIIDGSEIVIDSWCEENNIKMNHVYDNVGNMFFRFEDFEQMLFFKLKWR